jgi:hypothetical protein
MKLYDGEEVGDWKLAQIPEIKRAADHEGMSGLGPRAIVDVLSGAARRAGEEHHTGKYLTPVMALIAMTEYIERLEAPKDVREQLRAFVVDARKEIDRRLKDEVRKAFVPAFSEHAQELLENYLTNIEAYCQGTKTKDPITKEDRDPDEKLMRAIEEKVKPAVPQSAKDTFRQGVLMRIGIALRRGDRPLTYQTDTILATGIEEYLFDQLKDIVRVTVSTHQPRQGAGQAPQRGAHDPDGGARLQRALRARPARLRRTSAEPLMAVVGDSGLPHDAGRRDALHHRERLRRRSPSSSRSASVRRTSSPPGRTSASACRSRAPSAGSSSSTAARAAASGRATASPATCSARRADGSEPGEAGTEPGEEIYEVWLDMEEVEELLFSELELPRLRPRAQADSGGDAHDLRRHRPQGPAARQEGDAAREPAAQREDGPARAGRAREADLRYLSYGSCRSRTTRR